RLSGRRRRAGLTVGSPRPDRGPPCLHRATRSGVGHMSGYATLRLERHGPVGWLFFDRPERLNAMNARMRDELADAWIELDRNPRVRVIVHTGEGRAFQTGVDVAEL